MACIINVVRGNTYELLYETMNQIIKHDETRGFDMTSCPMYPPIRCHVVAGINPYRTLASRKIITWVSKIIPLNMPLSPFNIVYYH